MARNLREEQETAPRLTMKVYCDECDSVFGPDDITVTVRVPFDRNEDRVLHLLCAQNVRVLEYLMDRFGEPPHAPARYIDYTAYECERDMQRLYGGHCANPDEHMS